MERADQARFEQEWRKVEPRISGYLFNKGCSGDDINDLLQETCLRAYLNFKSLKGEFYPWVFGITRHVFIDYLRKRTRFKVHGEPEDTVDPSSGPAEKAISKELIRKCIDQLDGLDRSCLTLLVFGGKNLKEISEILEISIPNVHYHIEKARKHLRETFPDLVELARGGF